jgi:predicted RNase H-like nuclease (RuvC/YqgF family)
MTDLEAAKASIEGGESIARLVSKLKDSAIDLFFEVEDLRKKTSTLESQLAQVITRARLQKERDAETISDLKSQIQQNELEKFHLRGEQK